MPHLFTRRRAIRSSELIRKSLLIAMVGVAISLSAAVLVGVFGRGCW